MPVICVIDDRAAVREQIVRLATVALPRASGWEVREMAPLPQKEDYLSWLAEHHEIAVMILDENLHEQNEADGDQAVDYDGHDVVAVLRPRFPDFPIFIVTAVPDAEELQGSEASVENIIGRKVFFQDAKTHIARMIRSGQRFFDTTKVELARLGELSEKASLGRAEAKELLELDALRSKLSLPFSDNGGVAADLLPKAEQLIADARALIQKISDGSK